MDGRVGDLLKTIIAPCIFLVVYICVIIYVTVYAGVALNAGYLTLAVPLVMLLPLIVFAIRLDDKRKKEALKPRLRSGEFTPVQDMDKTVDEYRSMFDEEEKKEEEQ
jgi:hypothetical protein